MCNWVCLLQKTLSLTKGLLQSIVFPPLSFWVAQKWNNHLKEKTKVKAHSWFIQESAVQCGLIARFGRVLWLSLITLCAAFSKLVIVSVEQCWEIAHLPATLHPVKKQSHMGEVHLRPRGSFWPSLSLWPCDPEPPVASTVIVRGW